MKTTTVRDFKMRTSRYMGGTEDVLVTRRGRPYAIVTPVASGSSRSLMLEIGAILREAGISKAQSLKALEDVRKEVDGPSRP